MKGVMVAVALGALGCASVPVQAQSFYDVGFRNVRVVVDPDTGVRSITWEALYVVGAQLPEIPIRVTWWRTNANGSLGAIVYDTSFTMASVTDCPNVDFCNDPAVTQCHNPGAGHCTVKIGASCKDGNCDIESNGSGTCTSYTCLCVANVKTNPMCPGRGGTPPPSLDPGAGSFVPPENGSYFARMQLCRASTPLDPVTGDCTGEPPCVVCSEANPSNNSVQLGPDAISPAPSERPPRRAPSRPRWSSPPPAR